MSYLLFFAAISVFSGCKNSSSPSSGSINDIFPLAAGNTWVLQEQEWDGNGTLRLDTTTSILLKSKTVFQGQDGYILSIGGDTTGKTVVYAQGNSDLYTADIGSTTPYIQHILHYPMNDGDSYVLRDTTYSDLTISRDVLVLRSSNEPVTVPAGTFSTVHFDEIFIGGTASKPDTGSINMIYFAKGVGYIQEKDMRKSATNVWYQRQLYRLKSYKIN